MACSATQARLPAYHARSGSGSVSTARALTMRWAAKPQARASPWNAKKSAPTISATRATSPRRRPAFT